jgi:hypothetical protein
LRHLASFTFYLKIPFKRRQAISANKKAAPAVGRLGHAASLRRHYPDQVQRLDP